MNPAQNTAKRPDAIHTADAAGMPDTYGSNEIRLSARQWIVITLVTFAGIIAGPRLWKWAHPFAPSDEYRVPYRLSNDYWIFERWIERNAQQEGRIVVLGDSVVWGEYVSPGNSLAQSLNRQDHSHRFVNAGLNGTHPLALDGLVRYYTRALSGRAVVLHCNLLWMSSPERDLSITKEQSFNHSRLVPQFSPWVPCYKATVADRVGIVVDHHVELRKWVHHLRISYFENQDIPAWTLEHPYANPLAQVDTRFARPAARPHSDPIAWTSRGIPPQDLAWVEPGESLQWAAFQRAVTQLRGRRNRLFVIVGPFNQHLLSDASRVRFGAIRRQVARWLEEQGIPHFLPAPLPAALYADASHPLSAGYERLASRIYGQTAFRRWLDLAPGGG